MSTSLAIDGGDPVRNEPLAPWPVFADDEIEAVRAVLASGRVNYWTGGLGREFEQRYAELLGRRYALALMNGTVALELALVALGIGAGDEVLVPPRTFIASASCVVARGARPVFADVDPVSGNVTAETLEAARTPRTRAAIVVHLGGWPCDMPAIMQWAQGHGIAVIEDCAQAHGAFVQGRPVGSFGHAAAFSFCQDKILTTGGEGGMLLLDDEAAWQRAWAYKDHGKNYAAVFQRDHPPGFRWLHESFGTNWRMTEMQAAIGLAQLGKLDEWVETRRRHAASLDAALDGIPGLMIAGEPEGMINARYRYYAYIDPDRLAPDWTRERVMAAIQAEGVPCFVGSCGEIYRERAFIDAGLAPHEPLPSARRLAASSLALLVHPTLSREEVDDTARAVRKVLKVAMRAT